MTVIPSRENLARHCHSCVGIDSCAQPRKRRRSSDRLENSPIPVALYKIFVRMLNRLLSACAESLYSLEANYNSTKHLTVFEIQDFSTTTVSSILVQERLMEVSEFHPVSRSAYPLHAD